MFFIKLGTHPIFNLAGLRELAMKKLIHFSTGSGKYYCLGTSVFLSTLGTGNIPEQKLKEMSSVKENIDSSLRGEEWGGIEMFQITCPG